LQDKPEIYRAIFFISVNGINFKKREPVYLLPFILPGYTAHHFEIALAIVAFASLPETLVRTFCSLFHL